MHPRLSVNGISSFNWTLEQDIALYREIGLTVVGASLGKVDTDVAASADMIRAAGLRVSSLVTTISPACPLQALRDGSDAVFDQLRPAIDAAAAIGSPLCCFTSGPAPSRSTTDESLDALAQLLAPAVAYGRGKGVRLAVENTSVASRFHGFVHNVPDAVRVSRDGDVDICLELQNCWYEGNLASVFHENIGRIGIVQVNDFVVGEELKFNRRVPGDGDMPLVPLIASLLDAGYTGLFDIEVLGPSIEHEGYASVIRRSVDWLDATLTRLGA